MLVSILAIAAFLLLVEGSYRALRRPALSPLGHSKAFGFLFARFYELDHRYGLGLLDGINAALGPSDAEIDGLLQDGYAVLRWVLTRAMAAYPDTRFIRFNACWRPDSPQHDDAELAFARIFLDSGADYVPRVGARVYAAEATNCLPKNGHWNHRGHRVAGALLADYLATSESESSE